MSEKSDYNVDEQLTTEGQPSHNETLDVGTATITRRGFLRGVGAAAAWAGGVGVSGGFTVWGTQEAVAAYRSWRQRNAEQKRKEERARELFEELFGGPGELRHSYDGSHPDNAVAEKILRPILGLYDHEPQLDDDGSRRKMDLEGPLVAFGGPNSTPLTELAWGFRGRSKRELTRDPNAGIPLRFYGMSDETDPSLPRYRITYYRAGKRSYPTIPWPYVDMRRPDNPKIPEPGTFLEEIEQQGETRRVYLPKDNYLLVTKLPNYLGLDRQGGPWSWPQLLLFEGNNGIGTRGAELLLEPVGVEALEEVKRRLEGATAFQAMFRLFNIELTDDGSNRFRNIEVLDWSVTPLDISEEDYHKANREAWERVG